MKKFFRICLPIVLVMAIFVCGVIISKNLFGGENEYINISSLSDEFMNEYFSSYAEMAKLENKENILIVTSMHPIGDTFGATHVVEAPNHQYFLYYDSKSKKESALTKFSDDNTLKVQENMTYELTKDDGDGAGSIMTLGNGNSSFDSWGVEAMGLDYMAEAIENIDAEDVTVAILDTGLDVDLFNRYYNGKLAGTFNVLDPESEEISDNVGHGTHIAGTIAESTPSNVKIIAVQMTDAEYIDDTAIVTAVNYVSYYDKADVMNMSFGGYMMDEALYSAIEAANQKNIVSVAAAGNESTNRPSYPAAFNNTISISAVDSNLTFAGFSNRGESVSFAAPGVDIRSIMGKDVSIAQRNGNNDDDDHEIISGTSMATPHVVSAVADLKSINKSLSTANAIDLLKGNSVDLGVKGRDDRFGDGFIKFDDAIICRDAGVYDCDEFGVFEKDITANIVINDVIVTPYNYGSLTNILATTIKITTTNGREIIKPLGDIDIDEISISGYDDYIISP